MRVKPALSSWIALLLLASPAVARPKAKPNKGTPPANVGLGTPGPSGPSVSGGTTSTSPAPPPSTAVSLAPAGPMGSEAAESTSSPRAPALRNLKPRLAVLELQAPDLDPEERRGLGEAISSWVAEVSGLEVVTTEDLRAVLSLAENQQLAGCDAAAACVQDFGSLLAVEQVVSGSARKSGETFALSLQRVDLVNRRILGRTTQTTTSAAAVELRVAARRAVQDLFGVVGRLMVWDQPSGAELFLNGRRIGTTPVGPVAVQKAGTYDLRIEGAGVLSWATQVSVEPGLDVRVRAWARPIVEVEAEADAQQRLAWLTTGAGVAGLIAGGLLWGLAVDNDRRLDGLDLRRASQPQLDAITNRSLGLLLGGVALAVLGAAASGVGLYLWFDNEAQALLDMQQEVTR